MNGLAVEFQRRHSRDGTEELHPGLAQGFALLLAMLGPTIPALHIVRLVEEEVDAVEGILDEGNGGLKTRAGNGAAVAFEWVLAPSRRRVAVLPSGIGEGWAAGIGGESARWIGECEDESHRNAR
ncbi:MAG TPA: hypothetical protein VHM90_16125 [Phycisphaerae bacterium]|nr:hypothetical protein [Phycisphaerae bacterium]